MQKFFMQRGQSEEQNANPKTAMPPEDYQSFPWTIQQCISCPSIHVFLVRDSVVFEGTYECHSKD
jgi:hypothetical protein